MARLRGLLGALIVMTLLSACQRVVQYPAISLNRPDKASVKDDEDAGLYRLGWIEPRQRADLPIVFVPSTRKAEWSNLPRQWNLFPMPTGYLGLPPLQALAMIVMADHEQTIKIKVPLGLPDPTSNLPPDNLPTFGKWQLGKKLFSERLLQADGDFYSCASCHVPTQGFSDDRRAPVGGTFNTLSLINVVFNRRQFWDGRVETLEETLVHSLGDERKRELGQPKRGPLQSHVWGGFVRSLVQQKDYDQHFDRVFGVPHPTQDTVARALATYLRTILAGDSLYDRAEALRQAQKAPALTAEHFRKAMKAKDATRIMNLFRGADLDYKAEEVAGLFAKGHALFHGKARCAQCHTGPLFTDQDYHNVGYSDDEAQPAIGTETGRAVRVPIGHKDTRLIGAFRTPSLRNLAKTAPYFHNGRLNTLKQVVRFFNEGILTTRHLAAPLKHGEQELRLQLSDDEVNALVAYLLSLEGSGAETAP